LRILVVAPRYPHPATRGDQRRVLELLRVLRHRADVRLVTLGGGPPLPFDGVGVHVVRPGVLTRIAENLRRPDPLTPGQVRLFLDARMRRAVERETVAFAPNVVLVNLSRVWPAAPPEGRAHRHLDLVDSLALNMATKAQALRGPLRWAHLVEGALVGRWEARAVARADTASLVAEADRRGGPGLGRVSVVPNGVDAGAFPFAPAQGRAPVLTFFGNLGYFHAQEPARRAAEEVLPRVRRVIPDARLRLVGARPSAAVQALGRLDGVTVTGPVDDMGAELRAAAVAVLPAFTGSGMKNKVLEAFCSGAAVVANRLGVEGIEGAVAGEHYLVGEDADALAAACVTLLRDAGRRAEVAEAARALVEERHTWERRAEQLLALWGG